MSVIAVVNLTVKNHDLLTEYRGKAKEPLLAHGATILAAGPNIALESANGPLNTVVLSFPTQEAAEGWFNDPKLSDLHALRNEAADSSISLVPAFTG
jgi:uncharacterized protein (DUF1330 family)